MTHKPTLTEQVLMYFQHSIFEGNGVPDKALILEAFKSYPPSSVHRAYHKYLSLARATNQTYTQAQSERIRNHLLTAWVIAGLLAVTIVFSIIL